MFGCGSKAEGGILEVRKQHITVPSISAKTDTMLIFLVCSAETDWAQILKLFPEILAEQTVIQSDLT